MAPLLHWQRDNDVDTDSYLQYDEEETCPNTSDRWCDCPRNMLGRANVSITFMRVANLQLLKGVNKIYNMFGIS